MKYSTDLHEQYVLLQLQEDKLTSLLAPQLKSTFIMLVAEGKSNIILDLSLTKYVDSSGLSALLRAKSICENAGGIFVMYGLNPHVEKLVKISQLERVLTILPTKQEAIEAVFMHEIQGEIEEEVEE